MKKAFFIISILAVVALVSSCDSRTKMDRKLDRLSECFRYNIQSVHLENYNLVVKREYNLTSKDQKISVFPSLPQISPYNIKWEKKGNEKHWKLTNNGHNLGDDEIVIINNITREVKEKLQEE